MYDVDVPALWQNRLYRLWAESESLLDVQIKIKPKTSSKMMQRLAKLLKFMNPNFMDYTTTIWNTIYVGQAYTVDVQRNPTLPPIVQNAAGFALLAHEIQHVADRRTIAATYLLPHILSLPLFIIAPFLALWPALLTALVGIVLLTPLPNFAFLSWGRAWAEIRGYAMGIYANERAAHKSFAYRTELVARLFRGSAYYYPLPYTKMVTKLLLEELEQLRSDVRSKSVGRLVRSIL